MSRTRWMVAVAWLTSSGCQTLLGLEQAELDPSLEDDVEVTSPRETSAEPNPETSPTEDTNTASSSSEPSEVCEGFDNTRVKLLRADGTLPPLPDTPSSPEN